MEQLITLSNLCRQLKIDDELATRILSEYSIPRTIVGGELCFECAAVMDWLNQQATAVLENMQR